MADLSSRTVKFDFGSSSSQPSSTSTDTPPTKLKGRRKRLSSDSAASNPKKMKAWPIREKIEDSNVVFAVKEGVWDDVDFVAVNNEKYRFQIYRNCEYELIMSNTVEI